MGRELGIRDQRISESRVFGDRGHNSKTAVVPTTVRDVEVALSTADEVTTVAEGPAAQNTRLAFTFVSYSVSPVAGGVRVVAIGA